MRASSVILPFLLAAPAVWGDVIAPTDPVAVPADVLDTAPEKGNALTQAQISSILANAADHLQPLSERYDASTVCELVNQLEAVVLPTTPGLLGGLASQLVYQLRLALEPVLSNFGISSAPLRDLADTLYEAGL